MAPRTDKVLLSLGFLAIAASILFALTSLATGYEISIYGGTPVGFWISFGVLLIVCIWFLIAAQRLVFGGIFATGVVFILSGLPYLRGYAYFGRYDALNHLGSVRQILLANLDLQLNLYPAMHFLAAIVSITADLSANKSLLLLPIVFSLLYLFGMVLLARHFADNQLQFGVVIVLCLAYPGIISIQMPKLQPIPNVLTMLILPIVIASLVLLEKRGDVRYAGILIGLAGVLTLYHPQHSLAFIMFLTMWLIGNNLFERYHSRHTIHSANLLTTIVFSGTTLLFWISSKYGFAGAIVSIITGLIQTETAVSEISTGGSALQLVGGSLTTIFLRVFPLKIIISVVTIAFVSRTLWNIFRKEDSIEKRQICLLYLSLLPGIVLGILFFIKGTIGQFFRFAGVALMLGTIATGLAIGQAGEFLRQRTGRRIIVGLIGLVLIVAVISSIPVLYKSPYVYQPSEQVTEARFAGYDWIFESRPEDGPGIASLDTSVYRMRNIHYGKQNSVREMRQNPKILAPLSKDRPTPEFHAFVPYHFSDSEFNSSVDRQSAYIVKTEYGTKQHLRLYDGLRFDQSDMRYLDAHSAEVYSNGGTSVYHIRFSN
ncbi:hypothetical protein HISP_08486 [Haloarcula hispanica N601]|uniref:Glycosyltransferase RgtA/B/C/D-like domain-containing protein n=2 Tax=Haloarcula hispanica TaxID=51589 RepID=W0GGQ1_HALHI|nr:hypothetical protein [Haloarcula hispanica]AEM57270.1 conserved hypothetical protein [Haloarcula hispanica ATCC 33960]AHF55863.1 hypothetical protein HISP_08486 [Haloarcula hispanica N601]